MKIINPIAAAAMAASKTPAAARSLIMPACVSCPGDILSTSFSMAEFMASAVKTSPIHRIISIHSFMDILMTNPNMIVRMAINKCILMLCSSL